MGDNRGMPIETEIWSLTERAFGAFVASVPPPMTIGNVKLKDGRRVKGFLCEEYATHGALPISAHGGWRNYLESKASRAATTATH
jgi:allophanate hydrolase